MRSDSSVCFIIPISIFIIHFYFSYFQVGTHNIGNCRLACGACKVCKKGDYACINKNRLDSGYLDPSEDLEEFFGK